MCDRYFCPICGVHIDNKCKYLHRCNPAFIESLDKGRKSWEQSNEPREQGRTFHERLHDGFTATVNDPYEDQD